MGIAIQADHERPEPFLVSESLECFFIAVTGGHDRAACCGSSGPGQHDQRAGAARCQHRRKDPGEPAQHMRWCHY